MQNEDRQLTKHDAHNYGIDLLRIIAMLMVTTLHVLGHGGVLSSTQNYSLNYEISWAFETVCYCAVDVYVMITGFVYAGRQVRPSKILQLWCVVFFYSALIPVILKLTGFKIDLKILVSGFFPVLRSQYWFFSAYFALFFFIPILNKLLINKVLLCKTIIISFCLFSFLPLLGLGSDPFHTASGGSFLWFSILYLCGGYYKIYGNPQFLTLRRARIAFCISSVAMLLSRNLLMVVSEAILGTPHGGLFYSYCSPLVCVCAFCLLIIFSEKRFSSDRSCKIISSVSVLTFDVYLIHDNQSFRAQIINNAFSSFAKGPAWHLPIHIFFTVTTIFVGCISIGFLRSHLFTFLRIPKLISMFESKIERIFPFLSE